MIRFSSYAFHKMFGLQREMHRHFAKIVKSYSGHPETCKTVKTVSLKFSMKKILSFYFCRRNEKECRSAPPSDKYLRKS